MLEFLGTFVGCAALVVAARAPHFAAAAAFTFMAAAWLHSDRR